jgi:alanine racemase
MDIRYGTVTERRYAPKFAGLDDLGSSLIALDVSLGRFRENLRAIRAAAAPARVICVVKANAYGFGVGGLVPVLNEFEDLSCGVATPDEALELLALGYNGRIILLGYTHPKCYYQIVQSGCQLSAYRRESIGPLAEACRSLLRPLELHVKVDTGMTRLGVSVDDLADFLRELKRHPQLRVVGLFSHLADSGQREAEINARQEQRFRDAIRIAEGELSYHPECHLAGSGGLLNFPAMHFDAVRIGILSFGIYPPGEYEARIGVAPCFSLSSEVIDLHDLRPGEGVSYCHSWHAERPARIATLPFGYADGMPRNLGNRAEVLIGGRRCALVGNVTMDYVMVDVSGMDARIGDRAVFIGADGAERISVEEFSAQAGTVPYEITTRWGARVNRAYQE